MKQVSRQADADVETERHLFSLSFDRQGVLCAKQDDGAWHWRVYSLTDARARREIECEASIPEPARASLLAADGKFSLAYDDGWLHGSVPDFLHEHYGDSSKLGQLHLALSADMLLTGRRRPLQTLDEVRIAVERRQVNLKLPLDFLAECISRQTASFTARLAEISGQLDIVEDRIVGDSWQTERERLSQVRRQTVTLNRHVSAQHAVFRNIENVQRRNLPSPESDLLRSFAQQASILLHDIELVQARARLLQEEIMARLSERSNSLLSIISIMTAVMLPATIVTGMFGMNTEGLPFSGSPFGFWLATATAGVFAGLFYLLIRRLLGRF